MVARDDSAKATWHTLDEILALNNGSAVPCRSTLFKKIPDISQIPAATENSSCSSGNHGNLFLSLTALHTIEPDLIARDILASYSNSSRNQNDDNLTKAIKNGKTTPI